VDNTLPSLGLKILMPLMNLGGDEVERGGYLKKQ
jgi:hypothetical protein